jgi:hypothetical protein
MDAKPRRTADSSHLLAGFALITLDFENVLLLLVVTVLRQGN